MNTAGGVPPPGTRAAYAHVFGMYVTVCHFLICHFPHSKSIYSQIWGQCGAGRGFWMGSADRFWHLLASHAFKIVFFLVCMVPSLLTFARFSRIFNRFFLVCVAPSLLAFARSARILNRFFLSMHGAIAFGICSLRSHFKSFFS